MLCDLLNTQWWRCLDRWGCSRDCRVGGSTHSLGSHCLCCVRCWREMGSCSNPLRAISGSFSSSCKCGMKVQQFGNLTAWYACVESRAEVYEVQCSAAPVCSIDKLVGVRCGWQVCCDKTLKQFFITLHDDRCKCQRPVVDGAAGDGLVGREVIVGDIRESGTSTETGTGWICWGEHQPVKGSWVGMLVSGAGTCNQMSHGGVTV